MKEIHFWNLLRILGNPSLEKLIFEKHSEEIDLAGKVEQAKVYFENHNEVPHDNYNAVKKRLNVLLNRNINNTESSIVNEAIRAILDHFIFFLQEDFTHTRSIKSVKSTKKHKTQTSHFPPLRSFLCA